MSVSSTDSDDQLAVLGVSSRSHSAASTASTGSHDNSLAASTVPAAAAVDEATRRREQNKVSARRSRVKKKALMSAVHEVVEQQARSIADLEFKIGTLEAVLADARAAASAAAVAASADAGAAAHANPSEVEVASGASMASRMQGAGGGVQVDNVQGQRPDVGVGRTAMESYPTGAVAVAPVPTVPLQQEALQQGPNGFYQHAPRQQQYEAQAVASMFQPQQASWDMPVQGDPANVQMDLCGPQSRQEGSLMACGDGSGGSRCTVPQESPEFGFLDVPMTSVQPPLGMAPSDGGALVDSLDRWV